MPFITSPWKWERLFEKHLLLFLKKFIQKKNTVTAAGIYSRSTRRWMIASLRAISPMTLEYR